MGLYRFLELIFYDCFRENIEIKNLDSVSYTFSFFGDLIITFHEPLVSKERAALLLKSSYFEDRGFTPGFVLKQLKRKDREYKKS